MVTFRGRDLGIIMGFMVPLDAGDQHSLILVNFHREENNPMLCEPRDLEFLNTLVGCIRPMTQEEEDALLPKPIHTKFFKKIRQMFQKAKSA